MKKRYIVHAAAVVCLAGCVARMTPAQIAALPDTALCQRQLNLGNELLTDRRGDPFQDSDKTIYAKLADGKAEIAARGIDCAKIVQPVNTQ